MIFAYVGGTPLLARTYEPAERAEVLASHALIVCATTAKADLISGVMHAKAGWTGINAAILPLMLSIVPAALWLAATQRDGRAELQRT